MWTDKTRAKLSYSSITQKITLHMTRAPSSQRAGKNVRIRTFGGQQSTSSRHDTHARSPETMWNVRGLTPSTSVVLPLKEIPDGWYTYRKDAENVMHMDQGFDTIYVYTDVVESLIVGDSLDPLLRALSVRGSHGATVSDRFTNIHYVPVLYSHFHSIEMDIRNDTGRRVPFEYDRLTVTLHFRRCRTGLF